MDEAAFLQAPMVHAHRNIMIMVAPLLANGSAALLLFLVLMLRLWTDTNRFRKAEEYPPALGTVAESGVAGRRRCWLFSPRESIHDQKKSDT
jgi:hypothetical protein